MDKIYYDGNLKASLTVGNVSDINPLNAYTKDQVNELLEEKSDVNHTHEQYLTEHQDISHLATKEEIPSIDGLAKEEHIHTSSDIKIDPEYVEDFGVDTLNDCLSNLVGSSRDFKGRFETTVMSDIIREIKVVDELPEKEEEGILYLVRESGE